MTSNRLDHINALKSHANKLTQTSMRERFAADANRFQAFSVSMDDLLLDFSKCSVDADAMAKLFAFADSCGLEAKRTAMFSGEKINTTEGRAVLHTALRAPRDAEVIEDGANVMPDVHAVLDAMGRFADAVRGGSHKGATGEAITDIVNIGIGGSDLGPAMAALALAPYHDGPNTHFVSNIDPAHIADTLKGLNPATTLVIIASKTFTTIETMTNAHTARQWIVDAVGEDAVGAHFVAVSTALDKIAEFGISEDRSFGFWDWVGGRYSMWSAIGLPIMLAVGPKNFREMLDGAAVMDSHFRDAPMQDNLPVILGLIGYWHRVANDYPARAVIPYDQRLSRLPAYLQQLDMESNGKGVRLDGSPADSATGPHVWGEPGTNGQHAFFQLLHQGTDHIPVEFIIAAKTHDEGLHHQHTILLANCLAQSEALMKGRTEAEAAEQLASKGLPESEVKRLARHRVFTGNRPSITIMHDLLTPFAFGRLVALYEHRVFVESVLYDINAFDQWGVELGKELATALLPIMEGKEALADDADASTKGLVAHIQAR